MNGSEFGCTMEPEICGDLCTNGGRYCFPDRFPDPDGDHNGVTGSDVMREQLRRICLWDISMKLSVNDTSRAMDWW